MMDQLSKRLLSQLTQVDRIFEFKSTQKKKMAQRRPLQLIQLEDRIVPTTTQVSIQWIAA
jgi:hypothetical protein